MRDVLQKLKVYLPYLGVLCFPPSVPCMGDRRRGIGVCELGPHLVSTARWNWSRGASSCLRRISLATKVGKVVGGDLGPSCLQYVDSGLFNIAV